MNKQVEPLTPGEEDIADAPLGKENSERLIAMLDPDVLGTVEVELEATLGRGRLTMHRLASLIANEVVSLDTPINGTVDLALGGKVVARGELVAVGDNFGVRILEVLALRK